MLIGFVVANLQVPVFSVES